MLIAIMKVGIFLCILILPFRGPSRRRENTPDKSQSVKIFSKYGVNESGNLEMMETDDHTGTT